MILSVIIKTRFGNLNKYLKIENTYFSEKTSWRTNVKT
jgi:hypothetical protein